MKKPSKSNRPKLNRSGPQKFVCWKITRDGLVSLTYGGKPGLYWIPKECLWDYDIYSHIKCKAEAGALIYGDYEEALDSAREYHKDARPKGPTVCHPNTNDQALSGLAGILTTRMNLVFTATKIPNESLKQKVLHAIKRMPLFSKHVLDRQMLIESEKRDVLSNRELSKLKNSGKSQPISKENQNG